MFRKHTEVRSYEFRSLTEEEIERARKGIPNPPRKNTFLAGRLSLSDLYLKPVLKRTCCDCGKEIKSVELAFPKQTKSPSDTQDERSKRQWRCEGCHLIHEEKVTGYKVKGRGVRFGVRSKNRSRSPRE